MRVKQIKEFLLRTDVKEILPTPPEGTLLVSSNSGFTLEKYQAQMLKFAQDFKQTFEKEKIARLKLEKAYVQTISGLAKAVEGRDSYTGGHAERVALYAYLTAEEMCLPVELREEIKLAALLHDIGKISIPDAILLKGARLSTEEFEIMKTHPDNGIDILKNIQFLEHLIPSIRAHHESFDGKGYPQGLARYEIPVGARIIAVVDTFDAIISSRAYRKGSPPEAGLKELERCSGTQFDPEVVRAFTRACRSGKIWNSASK